MEPDPRSHDHQLPVLGRLDLEAIEPPEHVLAHVGHDEPETVELCTVAQQGRKVQVVLHRLVEEERLGDEQVGSARGVDQVVRPLGVPGGLIPTLMISCPP